MEDVLNKINSFEKMFVNKNDFDDEDDFDFEDDDNKLNNIGYNE